jgi:hypothetical protein
MLVTVLCTVSLINAILTWHWRFEVYDRYAAAAVAARRRDRRRAPSRSRARVPLQRTPASLTAMVGHCSVLCAAISASSTASRTRSSTRSSSGTTTLPMTPSQGRRLRGEGGAAGVSRLAPPPQRRPSHQFKSSRLERAPQSLARVRLAVRQCSSQFSSVLRVAGCL